MFSCWPCGAGVATSLLDKVLVFKIETDYRPFALIRASGKTMSCLAEVACDSAQTSGLTELSLEGHDMESQVKDPNFCSIAFNVFLYGFQFLNYFPWKDDGSMAPFRYKVKCQAMITCFEPKPLSSEGNGDDLRASMFGAAFLAPVPVRGQAVDAAAVAKLGLNKLPSSSNCQVLWEAPQLNGT